MLANLTLVNCYKYYPFIEHPDIGEAVLRSALQNLHSLAFFGLVEYQSESRALFEYTFNVQFSKSFAQREKTHAQKAEATELQPEQMRRIIELNRLDIELYREARRIFFERCRQAGIQVNGSQEYNPFMNLDPVEVFPSNDTVEKTVKVELESDDDDDDSDDNGAKLRQ